MLDVLSVLGGTWGIQYRFVVVFIQKVAQKEVTNGGLLGPLGSFGAIWASFGGPGEQNKVPKGAQERFYGYHKNIDFPAVFEAFWSLGAPKGGLERLLGAT